MKIQAKIKSKGFTVAQVAARMKNNRGGIGISQGSLSTALNGNPTIDKLKEVADIIGVSLSELVKEDDECIESPDAPFFPHSIDAVRPDLSSVGHHKTDINSILKASTKSKGLSPAQVDSQMRNERGDSIGNTAIMNYKNILKNHGWTITALAERMGITQSSLSQMIRPSSNPTIGRLKEIAEITGIPLMELVGEDCGKASGIDAEESNSEQTEAQAQATAESSSSNAKADAILLALGGISKRLDEMDAKIEDISKRVDSMR